MPRHLLRLCAAFAWLFLSPLAAWGASTQPAVSVSLGFSGVFKPDAWVPIYVRVADETPRAMTFELLAAHGRLGHSIVSRAFTSDKPTTYTLYAPISSLDSVSLQLRDATGRLVHELDLTDAAHATPAALGGPTFGVAGASAGVAQRVVNRLVLDSGEYIAAGAIDSKLLPERAVGYACLDVLVLPELDTDTLDDASETAIVQWIRAGGIVVAWPGPRRPTLASPLRDVLPDEGASFERRLGLGQITLLAEDPTARHEGDASGRLARWRDFTGDRVSLMPDDRRAGVFDPLVARAVAEQQLQAAAAATTWPTLLAALLGLGLIAGLGEGVALLAAGRSVRSWYTIAGLATAGLAAAAFMTIGSGAAGAGSIVIDVETEDGVVESISLSTIAGDLVRPALWLTGERLDALNQPAAELRLGQRRDGFEPLSARPVGGEPAKVRGVEFVARPASIAIDAGDVSRLVNLTTDAWSAAAIVHAESVQIASHPTATGRPEHFQDAVIADDPNTRRVETGIERLAAMSGWEAIFFDRALAERLVRLQETEAATIAAVRVDEAAGRRFILHVLRRQAARG